MKTCPNCHAQLDDNARFCLYCMTSLDEKEQIQPPVISRRRWPLVLLCGVVLCIGLAFILIDSPSTPKTTAATTEPSIQEDAHILRHTADGVCYTFRPATAQDHPTAIVLDNQYVLIRVEGTPPDGIYRVPTFVGTDTDALVTVIGDNAFAGSHAQTIDLGYNVRYVWKNAFGGYPLTDLYLHSDVMIDRTAFSGCDQNLTIHCPEYLENTRGALWSELAKQYGFRWQPEIL